jgi:hypothetical protein
MRVVYDSLRDLINQSIDNALDGRPCSDGDREYFFSQLLDYFDDYGKVPQITLKEIMRRDFTYSEGCGCKITFFVAAEYHTSRMIPGESCTDHSGRHQIAERDCLLERAKEALAEYLDQVQ